MDDFSIDRPELSGSLISMEFGLGGRVQQLWASDPNLPDQNEEFQFVISPLNLGEEFAEDYFPGTILLGARLNPDDPWMLSRNGDATHMEDLEDPGKVAFQYEFSLLPEIQATGKFYEQPGPIPQIIWEVELTNQGRNSLEIGELGFSFALNNIYEGYPRTDDGIADMLRDRVYIHKFIGGSASYLFAQRMNAEPPGLLIYPGGDTKWEFFNHVPSSLNTPYQWEGIPVVYVYSRAAIEREGWNSWFNEHTTLIMEPGDTKKFQTCFSPAYRDRFDQVNATLALAGRPAVRLLPGAVVPAEVGIAVEVTGVTPTQFYANAEAELETDSDEEGGFCFIKPAEPGLIRLSFEDTKGSDSSVHLLFTEPIEELIKKRGSWILEHQIQNDPASNLHGAFLATDIATEEKLTDPEDYTTPFGVESSLCDALFLAEKNTIYPVQAEVDALENYCTEFLLDDVQNPGDGSVGVLFADSHSISSGTGHPSAYPLVFNLYHTLYRVARATGMTSKTGKTYLRSAGRTIVAMFAHTPSAEVLGVGIPLMRHVPEIVKDLEAEGEEGLAKRISSLLVDRGMGGRASSAAFGRRVWSLNEFEQAFFGPWIDLPHVDREELMRLAYAARSLSPSWWWYGSDKRILNEAEAPHPAMVDKGEMCLGPTTIANSLMFFETLDRDYGYLPDAWLRLAFGGMLGVWALVRPDGAASMGFCPDAASKQYGVSALTGDIGLSLFRYLRNVACYVLPTRNSGVTTFGCHFETESTPNGDEYIVRPWDGVGRRIVVRQMALEVETGFGKFKEFRFDARKRRASFLMQNPSDKDMRASVTVRGLWGTRAEVSGTMIEGDPSDDGALRVPVSLPANGEVSIEMKVTG